MSQKERFPVFASHGTYLSVKAHLIGARRAHGLLKKKSDALEMRFRVILEKLIQTKARMVNAMKEAAFSYAEAKFATGDFNQVVLQNVAKAKLKIRIRKVHIAGVTLPILECYQDGADPYELVGLARGGQQLARLKKHYQQAVNILVELASYQAAFIILDKVVKNTKRSVNALELVIIPRLLNTLEYIIVQIDELERGEFYRLRKIQRKKKQIASHNIWNPEKVIENMSAKM